MSYYEEADLGRFPDVARFRKELMDRFFAWYEDATAEEGALSRREKALIALALAHSERCPYCIDAWTEKCLEAGADPDQMTEAVHVAASMQAGVTLVHAVQMHNRMDRSGV